MRPFMQRLCACGAHVEMPLLSAIVLLDVLFMDDRLTFSVHVVLTMSDFYATQATKHVSFAIIGC